VAGIDATEHWLTSPTGVLQALAVLGGDERIVRVGDEDTLRSAPDAKHAWTERGMIQNVTAGLDAVRLPLTAG
jgi:hypothetical protein